MRIGLLLVLLTVACGSSNNPQSDAPKQIDAPKLVDAKTFLDAPPPPALTVKNFDQWCSVQVNGGAASTSAMQVVTPTPGSIALVAKPANASFEVAGNLWHHTAGDTGAGDPGTVTGTGVNTQSATTVTFAGTATCVWVCCPFLNGTGCAGVADQCP